MSQESNHNYLWQIGAFAAVVVGVAGIGYLIERTKAPPNENRPPQPEQLIQTPTSLADSRAAPTPNVIPDEQTEEQKQLKQYLEEIEGMLKSLSKDHLDWCELATNCASGYIRLGSKAERADFLLKKAFSVHVDKLNTSEIEPFQKILELLYALHNKPEEAYKLTPYFVKVASLVGERLFAEKTNPDLQKNALRFLLLAFSFSYNAASWSLGDALWQISQLLPQSLKYQSSFLDKYTTGLHQQGKTLVGIDIIENFIKDLEGKNDEESQVQKQRFLSRVAKLYFYYDLFEKSREKLEMLELSDPSQINTILEYYQVLSELDLETELAKLETQIRQVPVKYLEDGHPIARSKYLMAMEINVIKQFIMVSFKVCRALPQRKEGEPESEETAARKLTKFFIVAQFEGTVGTVELEVNEFNFEVSSPPFSGEIPAWTRLTVHIYSDRSKSKLEGVHRQMVCNIPPKALKLQ